MAVDAEHISPENFNIKFKNYLRDFYLFQFKNNETDYYDKGSFLNARIFAACILVNKYNVSENDIYAIQMNDIKIDSDVNTTCIMDDLQSGSDFVSGNNKAVIGIPPKNAVTILVSTQRGDTDQKKIIVREPFSQMITLLYTRNATELFLTGNANKPISENTVLKFRNALAEYEHLEDKSDQKIFDIWKQLYLSTVNNVVKYGTFRNDSIRLNNIIAPLAGVTWKNGDVVNSKTGKITPNKVNKHVECITVDGRNITNNPFQELYKCCAENSTCLGQSFLLTYFLILQYHIGNSLERYDYIPFEKQEISDLNDFFISMAVNLESETRHATVKSWSALSEEDKQFFGNMAIEKIDLDYAKDCATNAQNKQATNTRNKQKEKTKEIKDIYTKILINNKRVVLVDDHFVLKDKSPFQASFIEKNVLYELYKKYAGAKNTDGRIKNLDEKQFRNNLNKLTRLGILIYKKQGERLFYSLSNVYLSKFLDGDKDFRVRFIEMVSLFSQVFPLGEVGNYILSRIANKPITNIRFKHNYLKRALNDVNLIDLLSAIEQKMWIEIEYRNAAVVDLQYQKFVCLPLEIRESVNDGRQYLLFYHPRLRSVSAVRIEFIDSIKMGEFQKKPYFADDISRAEKLIAYTWGTAFDNFKTGNVKHDIDINHVRVIIKCNQNEFFIKNRVQRECRDCISINSINDKKYGSCLELNTELVNFKEFLQWVRSLMCRVVSVEINGSEYIRFYDDAIKMGKLYNATELDPLCSDEHIVPQKETLLEFNNEFEGTNHIHDILFHELFSDSFHKVGCVLFDLFNQDRVNKNEILKKYIKQFDHAVANDRKKQLEVVMDAFVASKRIKKGGTIWSEYEEILAPVFSFKSNSKFNSIWDLIPLTNVEIQWLQNIICHPLAKCFLTSNEIKRIKYSLPRIHLFDINKTVLHDQFLEMENFYTKFETGNVVRTILQAIREKRALALFYQNQYKETAPVLCYPSHIEYSKRDNRIRIRGISDNKVKTFNVERICDISITDDYFDHEDVAKTINEYDANANCNITIYFDEIKNIPDRILTELSCFNKTCIKCGKDRYRMTLFYNEDDAKEILIRLLSYGPYIFIDEDNGPVREEYIARIKQQLELIKTREIVKEHIERSME